MAPRPPVHPREPVMLFLVKKNQGYSTVPEPYATKAGLLNSARITDHQLQKHFRVITRLEICIDGNSVDKFLHKHKPDYCIVQAIWITPDKLRELVALHPMTIFVIRVHSEVPFLANEGNAIDWITEYSKIKRVMIAFNSKPTTVDLIKAVSEDVAHKIMYIPNIYNHVHIPCYNFKDILASTWRELTGSHPFLAELVKVRGEVHIGCFGAIRPMKNHLMQAMAAIRFAREHNLTLFFHINVGRQEQGGQAVYKNLIALFRDNETMHLVSHPWLPREKFLELAATMDIGMQLSMSESFNIVTADLVSRHVPMVVSDTISWMPEVTRTRFDSGRLIAKKLKEAVVEKKRFIHDAAVSVDNYNRAALATWKRIFDLKPRRK